MKYKIASIFLLSISITSFATPKVIKEEVTFTGKVKNAKYFYVSPSSRLKGGGVGVLLDDQYAYEGLPATMVSVHSFSAYNGWQLSKIASFVGKSCYEQDCFKIEKAVELNLGEYYFEDIYLSHEIEGFSVGHYPIWASSYFSDGMDSKYTTMDAHLLVQPFPYDR